MTVHFGGLAALEDVSLTVARGEVVGLIGPNGAGKTTLFNVICGFVKADDGTVSFAGSRRRGGSKPHQLNKAGVARTLQGLGLWPELSLVENVMTALHPASRGDLGSALLGLPRSSRDERRLRQRSLAALDRLGIAEHAERLPSTLPYPVQKQACIARALVTEPELLLLDEPASGLGEGDIAALGELVAQFRSDLAVLLVEHHMDFVMSVCERLVVLDFGKVIAAGSPAEVRADPNVMKAYLGEEVST